MGSALRTRGSGIPGQAAAGTREQPGRQGHTGPRTGRTFYRISVRITIASLGFYSTLFFKSLGQKVLAFLSSSNFSDMLAQNIEKGKTVMLAAC